MDNGERDGPKCACTPEWPCMWHGTEGRDADVADVPEAVLRVQYQTEDRFAELSPGVPWTPPVELRPADRVPEQGARPAAVAEVLELGEQFDAIE